ncbi:GNAT family N-acetyltransferase [Paenibacillus sp. MMS20-IR301]|uniref:GNAT family N-acetyltransferase n=1 Tax=Paenibacillus sp. MMS20-IR301 TaxID=2895946 RepID=UPI0028E34EFD|nr:GNAT family N-acetyltransferase [Paenibacillus sp. MMS20-IR301]WNS42362.1 GNAT family N-acetyltransferase [Paenibacillus sp. MMS20-IR301]
MSDSNIIAMTYHSKEQEAAVRLLEQQCTQAAGFLLSSDIEHLIKEDGDHALLCYRGDQLVGLLSWFDSGSGYAQINAMVHPEHRRRGVFRSLMQRAGADISRLDIQKLSFRIPARSRAGLSAASSLGAVFDRSEYSMILAHTEIKDQVQADIRLLPASPEDFEFMVTCSSRAFGDPEDDAREYFLQTTEPERITYIAWTGSRRIGLIRVNYVNEATAFIHNFCVLPDYQGKGYGGIVLRQIVDFLLQEHYSSIRLGVVTENERALNLYLNAGFQINTEYKYYSGSLS